MPALPIIPKRLFLAGTDTGVGKTHVACLLLRAMTAAGISAAGFKPICCGEREDPMALHAAGDPVLTLNDLNPVWLRTPAAPYTAAIVENRAIDLGLIREKFTQLSAHYPGLVVEGIGGWRVPIERDYDTADLAVEFALPVVLVVHNRLGAINHTLLTLESIRARGLICSGIILNHPEQIQDVATTTNRAMLEELTALPILAEIEHGQAEIAVCFE